MIIRRNCLLAIAIVFAIYTNLFAQKDEIQSYKVDKNVKVEKASPEAVERFKDKRFGMFIHWGPISQLGKQLSHSRNSKSHKPGGKPYKIADIEPEVYDVQYKTFNPTKYDPDYIVDLAKRAGMKYLVFTAKHHAGFSMFDSKVTDYDIMNTPYGKDILKELEQACRKQNFDFGFYYSPRDWYNPDCDSKDHHDRYITFYKAQMEELLNNYGKINEIWFDGLGPGDWKNTSAEVMARIRELQPDAMVNDRGGVGADFYTPEHTVSQFNNQQLWEACHTTTSQWGYNPDTNAKSLKQLMQILLYTWGSDGNMLLNIGPMGDGALNPEEVKRLEQIADWWAVNGEKSIAGSRGGPYFPSNWGVSTRKGNKVFLHVFNWQKNGTLTLPNFPNKTIRSVSLLNGKKIELSQNTENYTLTIPKQSLERIVTTVAIELNASAMDMAPMYSIKTLTQQATLTASQNQEATKNVIDGNPTTVWHASTKKNKDIWIQANFEKPETIESFVAGRGEEWVTKNNPELQIPDGNGGWKTIYKWKPKFEPLKYLKNPVTTDKIRLKVKNTKDYYLAEFELYAPLK
ncbi:alpha-L-fucosidase [Tamlana sp. I1]|uniref:alpha-L-fucosidase n=1 Tax=Tamlana sp. I1 TaxID=2762061 RepID=UPI00188E872D|nr:alpha-L-fucosidase [Tamlana sp. I1]